MYCVRITLISDSEWLKVGSAVPMAYITGHPIVFVGTGHKYTDLRGLDSSAIVASH
jgi:signal recognition particle GTPase